MSMLIILKLMTRAHQSLGFLISDAARLMRRRFDRLTGETGLTRAQFQLLARVARSEGISQAGLADLLDMEPISVCRIIDRMEAGGWLTRKRDPNDRRAYQIYMTEAALPALDRMQAVADDVYADMLAGFSAKERESLMDLLARLHANAAIVVPQVEEAEGPVSAKV